MRSEKGFTLIELILVMTIMGVAVSGIMLYFIQGVGSGHQSQQRTTATTLAQDLMEEIHSKCWDETAASVSPCQGNVTPSSIGSDGGENRATYDDMDDFNGLNNTPPLNSQGSTMASYTGYNQQVSVCYVDVADLNTCKGSGTSDFKKIVVDIFYGGGQKTELVTVVTNY